MKNKLGLAIVSGLLLAISWPTYGLPFLLFIAFVPLLWVEYQIRTSPVEKKLLKVFGYSYLTFFIWNAITTWWIWYATPFGMFFALIINSLLMTLVMVCYHLIAKRTTQKVSLLFLITLWISFEKFHQNWDFSWPWLNLGNGFATYYQWIQWYEFTGIFGGTLWVWIVNTGVFVALVRFQENNNVKSFIKQLLLQTAFVVVGITISLYIYHNYQEKGEAITAVVLQPNIDPYSEKYHKTNAESANELVALAKSAMDSTITFVIAPETAIANASEVENFNFSAEYFIIKDFINQYPTTHFLGGISFYSTQEAMMNRIPTSNYYRRGNIWYNSYNSAFLIDKTNYVPIYHKSKLVVGVEHIPYRSIVEPLLGNVMINLGGSVATLTPQKERDVFTTSTLNYVKAAPIICYESVYGEYVTKYIHKKADFLAIITNDGWWSTSQGHKQHLTFASLRAIETRRSITRSANTGISAIINQKGDLVKFIPYGEKGVLKEKIQLNKEVTFYTQHGDYIARISIFIMVLVLLSSLFRKREKL
ncbi:MAG TPA: apolipoprotein N-acyltransferase [Flavobacteriaceae bacterium]|nr:apolipoprotein N-acyltransferase [Flavobacteriaceae bacterium]HEX5743293.1 apolipoprotein N-acyltransferase [Flavobacteriaceae bacterium]